MLIAFPGNSIQFESSWRFGCEFDIFVPDDGVRYDLNNGRLQVTGQVQCKQVIKNVNHLRERQLRNCPVIARAAPAISKKQCWLNTWTPEGWTLPKSSRLWPRDNRNWIIKIELYGDNPIEVPGAFLETLFNCHCTIHFWWLIYYLTTCRK